ncbi:uncharacterized protein EI90DRAFT_2969281 [Cantharellus anzutake]|uniref:uncharacterized protein n=1 Tax=Cantharellus anzutake TaxID=1750568 RepID=UPI0019051786|nr:uncharacterized protein EI90DRAFT_2969281 [Cantharellus anzutake]KAF8335694.1 hypothetical protein EI90DRAFT_2969281 [Cantharellus anzutake]
MLVEPQSVEQRLLSNSFGPCEGEHELYWYSNVVIWSVAGVQKRRWAFADHHQTVTGVCFAWLDGSKLEQYRAPPSSSHRPASLSLKAARVAKQAGTFSPFTHLDVISSLNSRSNRSTCPTSHIRVICIFLRDIGYFYSMDGLEFTINLPFTVKRVSELLPVGVLLHAALNVSDEKESRKRGSPMMPLLYSITSPFDEPRPIIFASEIIGGMSCAPPGRSPSDDLPRIVYSPDLTPSLNGTTILIATLDAEAVSLRLFRYVYIKRNDRPSPLPRLSSKNARRPGSLASSVGVVSPSLDPVATFGSAANRNLTAEFEQLMRASGDSETEKTRRSSLPRAGPDTMLDRLAIGGTGVDELRQSGTPDHIGLPTMDEVASGSPIPGRYPDNKRVNAEFFVEKLWELRVTDDIISNPATVQVVQFDARLTQSTVGIALQSRTSSVLHVVRVEPGGDDRLTARYQQAIPNVISIAPVQSTRSGAEKDGIKDLLCLRNDGSLFLLCPGGTIEVALRHDALSKSDRLSISQSPSPSNHAASTSQVPVKLLNAVRSGVSLQYSDGSLIRLNTDLTPQHELIQRCFQALSHVCSASRLLSIRKEYLVNWLRTGSCGSIREEFACFSRAVMRNLGRFQKNEFAAMDPSHDTDAWSKLAFHHVHSYLRNDPALLHLHLPFAASAKSPDHRSDSLSYNECGAILHGLHLLAEEFKLDSYHKADLDILVPLLVDIAKFVGADWADYWIRLVPDASDSWDLSASLHTLSPVPVPDLGNYLNSVLGSSSHQGSHVILPSVYKLYQLSPSLEYGTSSPTPLSESVISIYSALRGGDLDPSTTRERAQSAVKKMADLHFSPADIDRLPLGLSAPIREAIKTCQLLPPSDWSQEAYLLIGRNDIAQMTTNGEEVDPFTFGEAYQLRDHAEKDQVFETIDCIADQASILAASRHETTKELDPNRLDFARIRFSEDQRLAEVDSILNPNKLQIVKIPERQDLNEHELAKELAATVYHIIERTFSLAFGRAIFLFGSLPKLARDEFSIPPLVLDVKFVPHNVTYPADLSKTHTEAKAWAEFHNGVAASLRISTSARGIDSAWIAYNKPHELTAEHAGYLLGLGLTGHLRSLWNWHGYRYLVPKHELTSIAILLGLGAAHVGLADSDITRILTIHMRPLLPPDSAELGIPLGAQSAALMGLGLLYLGTMDRAMADVALEEMSASRRLGGPEISNEHKEAYTITAALAFGMIMCGHGSEASGPSDTKNVQTLRAFVDGKQPGDQTRLKTPQEALPTAEVNMNFVSPAATIALALMYLKTNRADIAASFALPPDPAGLREIQPSLLLLRALGKSLVMWDDIEPSVTWVLSQAQGAPKDLTKKQIQEGVKDLYEYAFFNILSGACLAIGLKYAGTAKTTANQVLIHFHDKLLENLRRQPNGQTFELQLRRSAIREAINVVDLALGIVMAGTGDVACMQRFRVRHGLFGPQFKYGAHIATHMAMGFLFLGGGRYTLGTSNAAIACLVAALYPRFPLHSNETRGLLQAFRYLWVIAVEPRCLIARDADTNEIARIPIKFKVAEPDEPIRTHHFTCPTLLPDFGRFVSLKIDSPRYWPFVLDIAGNERNRDNLLRTQTIYVKRRTGFLAYASDPMGFQSLSIWNGSPVGDPSILDFPKQVLASATASAQSSPSTIWLPRSFDDMRHFTTQSSNDPALLAFADRFCRHPGLNPAESMTTAYCQQSLLEVLSADKPQVLESLLTLYLARIKTSENTPQRPLQVKDVILAHDFYVLLFRLHGGLADSTQRQPLLRIAALQATMAQLGTEVDALRRDAGFMACYRAYVRGEDIKTALASTRASLGIDEETEEWTSAVDLRTRKRQLSLFLINERVPSAQTLYALRRLAMSALSEYRGHSGNPAGSDEPSRTDRYTSRNSLALVVQKTALSVGGNRNAVWSLESVYEVLDFWAS